MEGGVKERKITREVLAKREGTFGQRPLSYERLTLTERIGSRKIYF